MKFRSSSQLRSERLSRLSLIVMALGVAALVAAGVLFGLSATGIIGDGGLQYSGPGTVTGFGSVVQTPVPATPSPLLPPPSEAPLARLVIPNAEVDAPVVTLGIDGNGVMQSPEQRLRRRLVRLQRPSRLRRQRRLLRPRRLPRRRAGRLLESARPPVKDDLIEVRLEDGTVYQYHVSALECLPVGEAPINRDRRPHPERSGHPYHLLRYLRQLARDSTTSA